MAAGAHRPEASHSRRVAVAVSGGLDSTCLLHAVLRQGANVGLEVVALHVNHGLMADADRWEQAVRSRCRRWGPVELYVRRLSGQPAAGQSVEAWARRERYAALAEMAHAAGCDLVLLAHHRRDQAETVLLQALRGAGPAGLSAMPRSAVRLGITWARPWLDQPHDRITAYAQRHRLRGVNDPSNADERFARSRLRQRLWPALLGGWPDAETALLGVARQAQDARALQDEVAAEDLPLVTDPPGRLQVPAWGGLTQARRANVLRHWLATCLGQGAPHTLVDRLLHELPQARSGATWPAGAGCLHLHRSGLQWVADARPAAPLRPQPAVLDLRRPGHVALSAFGGVLEVTATRSGGLPITVLQAVAVRARAGGEQFQSHPAGVPRALKKQFQDADTPRWQRQGPLLWHDDRLLFVAGLGMDARAVALDGAPRRHLRWWPDAPASADAKTRPSRIEGLAATARVATPTDAEP